MGVWRRPIQRAVSGSQPLAVLSRAAQPQHPGSCGCRHFRATSVAAEKTDFYEVLGISREASPSEVKRGYYAAAKRHHPDTNKGDPAAAKKFAAATEAYEILSDAGQKKRYDAYGHDGVGQNQGGGGGGNPFGGGGGFPGFGFGGGQSTEDIFAQFDQAPTPPSLLSHSPSLLPHHPPTPCIHTVLPASSYAPLPRLLLHLCLRLRRTATLRRCRVSRLLPHACCPLPPDVRRRGAAAARPQRTRAGAGRAGAGGSRLSRGGTPPPVCLGPPPGYTELPLAWVRLQPVAAWVHAAAAWMHIAAAWVAAWVHAVAAWVHAVAGERLQEEGGVAFAVFGRA